MFICNNCSLVFHDVPGSWNEVDERDELIEDSILRCPRCASTDVGVADETEEEELPDGAVLEDFYH